MKGGEHEEEGNDCHSPALSFPCLIPVGLSVGTGGILRGREGLQLEINMCFSPSKTPTRADCAPLCVPRAAPA